MYYYFHVLFKDNPDIYIVRVSNWCVCLSVLKKEAAATIINELHGVKEEDFEIIEVEIPESILSRLVFINNIAQLEIITHP